MAPFMFYHISLHQKNQTKAIWAELFWYDLDCAYLKQLDSL